MESLLEPESLLIAHLENTSTSGSDSGSTPLLSLFRSHLDPFNSLLNANPQSTQNSIPLSLVEQFLPFLNRSLTVLPKRLSDPQFLQSNANGNASPSKSSLELFDIYRHCLNCLELVSSQLSCKPWKVHMQRVTLVRCLDKCGHYKEAECEGYRILQNIKGLNLGGEMKKTKRKKAKDDEENLGYLPQAMENVDGGHARFVVEVVKAIVRCLALRGSKDGGDYKRVMGLVKEVRPWFRMLSADEHERLHKELVIYLRKCLVFLAGELMSFDGDIVHAFCAMTLDELAKSSKKDQLYKFARRICSSLFLLQCDRPSMVTDVLICVLDFLVRRCKDEAEEFVEFVSYCASKCLTACTYFCATIEEHFNVLAGNLCQKVYEDIESAINLWLSIPIPDCGVAFDDCSELPDSALLLLYNIVDLLSMKGSAEFPWHIFKLMISLFKWKNVQLEKCLSLLWDSRRLSHALCVSPIVDEFATNLSGDFGEEFKSTNSWMRCLKGSTTSLIGFQQKFSISCANFCCGTLNHDTSFWSDITVDSVKEAAVKLISMVPATSCSGFIAGYLYYDLSERLIASGRLFEALSYAKEAHQLRNKLFQEYFAYSIEKHDKKCTEVGDRIQKRTYGIQNLQVRRSIAREIWSFCAIPWDVEACYLSPWKVLQCYLESTLQVGMIHEIVGNGVEAENFLLWGKDISCLQSLPLFIAAFSSALGKVYRKKQSWDLSEKELQIAKKMLEDMQLQ